MLGSQPIMSKNLSDHCDKCHKVVILSREYENISVMSLEYVYNEFKPYRWYETISSHKILLKDVCLNIRNHLVWVLI